MYKYKTASIVANTPWRAVGKPEWAMEQEKGAETDKPAKKMAPSKGKEPAVRKRKSS